VTDVPQGLPIPPPGPDSGDLPDLTAEQQMLVDLRDTLYEGSWEDFANDLRARRAGRPHVFDVVPPSPRLIETIDRHLRVISELEHWERRYGRTFPARG